MRSVICNRQICSRAPPLLSYILKANFAGRNNDRATKISRLLDGEDSGIKSPRTKEDIKNKTKFAADSKLTRKLSRSLIDEKSQNVLEISSQGYLDMTCEEVLDYLNEALEANAFIRVFKGAERASMVVQFIDCKVNMDYSHAHVYWESDVTTAFVQCVYKSEGKNTTKQLAEKMAKSITDKLQQLEPKFRAELVKRMDFKRIPRIYFRCKDPSFGLAQPKERDYSSGKDLISELMKKNRPAVENNRKDPTYRDRVFP